MNEQLTNLIEELWICWDFCYKVKRESVLKTLTGFILYMNESIQRK